MNKIMSTFGGKKLLILLAIPFLAAACNSQPTAESTKNSESVNSQTSAQPQTQGRAVFSITDATPDIQNVTAVQITIDKLEVLSSGQAWVTVNSTAKTFDLMALKTSGTAQLIADLQLPVGTYNQIRLHVTKVVVTKAGVQSEAKLPSNELKIVGKVVVKPDATASVKFDFLLDKSLHLTGNGMFILAPVIKLDSQSDARVQINANNEVKLESGQEEESIMMGSDENGMMKNNFEFDSNQKLDLTNNGSMHMMDNNQSETGLKIDAQKAIDIAIKNGSIDLSISVKLETKDGKKVWHVVGKQGLSLADVFVDAQTGVIVMAQ